MFRKTVLAAALVASSVVGVTSASAFNAFFAPEQTQVARDYVDLGNFNAPGAGVVEIHDFRLGTIGDLLGSHDVTDGANADLRVELSAKPLGNVVALLKVGGETVGMEMIRITNAM
jgi:hypothetical protein